MKNLLMPALFTKRNCKHPDYLNICNLKAYEFSSVFWLIPSSTQIECITCCECFPLISSFWRVLAY